VLENLAGAVEAVLILGRLQSLHASFDDVDGRVAVDGSRAGDGTKDARPQLRHFLVFVVAAIQVLEGEQDPETNGLVGTLLDDGGTEAFVASGETLALDDRPNAVEESLEFGIGAGLIVDELDFERFHGRDGEDGFRDAGAETAKQFPSAGQLAGIVGKPLLERLEGAEADGRLGDGTVEKYGEAAVETEEAVTSNGLLDAVDGARVLLDGADFLVQLQLRLDVFRRERDANLDAARDAAGDDSFRGLG